jgi:D-3-phosphoglycerate dehydrogenase
MASARNIPQANASLKSCQWKRNDFMGTELRGKTLGIVGLGNVGSEVAKRAAAFEMKLLGIDPLVSEEYAKKLGVTLVDLPRMMKECDFITLHIPLTAQTRGLIGAKELAMAKPGMRIINCARARSHRRAGAGQGHPGKAPRRGGRRRLREEPCTESILFGENKYYRDPTPRRLHGRGPGAGGARCGRTDRRYL